MTSEVQMLTGRILIVDDELPFLETYRELLGEEGYVVETATSREEALEHLKDQPWDVVLLDQKLQGSSGPDNGIDLLGEVQATAPGSKLIMVTAYATKDAIERAFASGAYDYLEKNARFSAMLRVKVRNALEVTRERRLVNMAMEDTTEAVIRQTWDAVDAESDANKKGKLLEDLMDMVFRTIPGFSHVSTRRRNELEEIDLIIRNESSDSFWIKTSAYLLVECKNWSSSVGVEEYRSFLHKIERRYGRCKLGFFVAPGGFTKTFLHDVLTERKGDTLVVPVDSANLSALISSTDRNGFLKDLHDQALI